MLKAYRELDHRGLTSGKVSQGTFIQSSASAVSPAQRKLLRRGLHQWMRGARAAALTDADIDALVEDAFQLIEAGIYLGLILICAALAFWRIRRRTA